jgi:L-aspartate oxidase
MWERVGIVRCAAGLERALDDIDSIERGLDERSGELRNLVEAGRLIATAALARRETRGSHARSDYPSSDESLRRRLPIVPAPAATAAGGDGAREHLASARR